MAASPGRAIDFALKVHYDLNDRWNVAVGYRTLEGGADNDKVYTFAWLHYAVASVRYDSQVTSPTITCSSRSPRLR